jgi:hypothetical protein
MWAKTNTVLSTKLNGEDLGDRRIPFSFPFSLYLFKHCQIILLRNVVEVDKEKGEEKDGKGELNNAEDRE